MAKGHTDDLKVECAVQGEREGEEGEGVKAHAAVAAHFTRHNRLELKDKTQ